MNSKIRKHFERLIRSATEFGLPEVDIYHANQFLSNNELGLCFDQIITQLYEFDIKVDAEFYKEVNGIAKSLSIPSDRYLFFKTLIK